MENKKQKIKKKNIEVKNNDKNEIKITDIYLNNQTIKEAQDFFEKEAFIQLNSFLENENIIQLKNKLEKQEIKEIYNPMKHRFQEINISKIYDLDLIKLIEFFRSKFFLEYIEDITGFNLSYKFVNLRKFSHWDFTLIHDDFQEKEDIIDVIFDLSDIFQENMGGILTYATKEEEIFYLDPSFNSLSILYKPESVISYLKYINNLAENRKILRFEIQFDIVEDIN